MKYKLLYSMDEVNINEFLEIFKESSKENALEWYPESTAEEALEKYENTFLMEALETKPDCRKKGFASEIIRRTISCLEEKYS